MHMVKDLVASSMQLRKYLARGQKVTWFYWQSDLHGCVGLLFTRSVCSIFLDFFIFLVLQKAKLDPRIKNGMIRPPWSEPSRNYFFFSTCS